MFLNEYLLRRNFRRKFFDNYILHSKLIRVLIC